jgi:hypothetical protein
MTKDQQIKDVKGWAPNNTQINATNTINSATNTNSSPAANTNNTSTAVPINATGTTVGPVGSSIAASTSTSGSASASSSVRVDKIGKRRGRPKLSTSIHLPSLDKKKLDLLDENMILQYLQQLRTSTTNEEEKLFFDHCDTLNEIELETELKKSSEQLKQSKQLFQQVTLEKKQLLACGGITKLLCICKQPYTPTLPMLTCDICDNW